jgi:hypothetical protein
MLTCNSSLVEHGLLSHGSGFNSRLQTKPASHLERSSFSPYPSRYTAPPSAQPRPQLFGRWYGVVRLLDDLYKLVKSAPEPRPASPQNGQPKCLPTGPGRVWPTDGRVPEAGPSSLAQDISTVALCHACRATRSRVRLALSVTCLLASPIPKPSGTERALSSSTARFATFVPGGATVSR